MSVVFRAPHHTPCASLSCAHLPSFGGPSQRPCCRLTRVFHTFFSLVCFAKAYTSKVLWLLAALPCVSDMKKKNSLPPWVPYRRATAMTLGADCEAALHGREPEPDLGSSMTTGSLVTPLAFQASGALGQPADVVAAWARPAGLLATPTVAACSVENPPRTAVRSHGPVGAVPSGGASLTRRERVDAGGRSAHPVRRSARPRSRAAQWMWPVARHGDAPPKGRPPPADAIFFFQTRLRKRPTQRQRRQHVVSAQPPIRDR